MSTEPNADVDGRSVLGRYHIFAFRRSGEDITLCIDSIQMLSIDVRIELSEEEASALIEQIAAAREHGNLSK